MHESGLRSSTGLGGSEYEVIHLRPSWGLVSIALAVAALYFGTMVESLPWRSASVLFWPVVRVLGTGALALLGMVAGALGTRQHGRLGIAKIGLVLNLGVLISVAVIVAGGLYVLYG